MIIERLKDDFYVKINQERVLLLVSLDVDSLCAAKILQLLFKNDNVQYTMVPVSGKNHLQQAYTAHIEEMKCVVMINCGGCFNVLDLLQPDSDVKFYIIDSYRPLLLENIYNHGQVNILVREDDKLDIPEFEDIFAYMDESESEEDEYFSDEDSGPREKRRKRGSYEARKQKQLWKKRKNDIMFKYNEYCYHETAASLVLYDLAWKMSKDNNDILWWAIVGLTDQYAHHKIDQDRYINDIGELQRQVLRHNRTGDDETVTSSVNSMKIAFDNELRLLLYRHWTLYDSFCHSAYTACRFRVWTTKGQKKLQEFLAEMGLPLVQCKQKFSAMDMQYKENLREWINEHARKYNLDDICYGSFTAQFGFKNKFCALDVVSSAAALIEQNSQDYSLNFLNALDALSRINVQQLITGLEVAKQQQTAVVNQARSFIETKQIVCAGPFVYTCIEEGVVHSELFSRPLILAKLARFLMESWVMMNKKSRGLPFLLSAPLNTKDGTCILTALPPYADDSCKSEFGRAFQQAAARIHADANFDYFNAAEYQSHHISSKGVIWPTAKSQEYPAALFTLLSKGLEQRNKMQKIILLATILTAFLIIISVTEAAPSYRGGSYDHGRGLYGYGGGSSRSKGHEAGRYDYKQNRVYGYGGYHGRSRGYDYNKGYQYQGYTGGGYKGYTGGGYKGYTGGYKGYTGGDYKGYTGGYKGYTGGDYKGYTGGGYKGYTGGYKGYTGGGYTGGYKGYTGGDYKGYTGGYKGYGKNWNFG